jgi:NAD(P)-dependent dehydrogenase (short-subunit alcohol dehydrogenase family)
MSKVIAIVGFGPGTATAVADRFGAEGFSVALVGRNEERLAAGVSALNARGITAFGFRADAADSTSIRATLKSISSQVGPIAVLHWNAYGGLDVGDLLTADPAALHGVFDVAIFGLLAAVDESLADLKKSESGAVLVSNGGFGEISSKMDELAAKQHFMGIALASAAKQKLVGLLAPRLKDEGIYVGEVTTYGTIQGTTPGVDGSIDPTRIAGEFWRLYQLRSETRGSVRIISDKNQSFDPEAFVRNAYAVAERKDLEGWKSLFNDDGVFVDESVKITYKNPNWDYPVRNYGTAFADMHRELYNMWSVGNTVFVRLALQGTHTGPLETPFGTIPPTGNKMDAPCLDVFELEDGKIQKFDCYPSGSVILTQLGVIEDLKAAVTR